MIRTFIALEMNEALQRHLTDVIHRMALLLPSQHWVNPTGIHLTLAFLGELTDEQLLEAAQAAENVVQRAQPFSYQLSLIGIFGQPHQPRVIWMGIHEPSGALSQLHTLLNKELEQKGFAIEKRPFSPHLTLARVKSPLPFAERQALQHLLAGSQSGISSSNVYSVHSIHIMKSELFSSGAQYTPLRTYTFPD